MTFDPTTLAAVIVATVFLAWRLHTMSDSTTQIVTDIHQMTAELATLKTNIAAVHAKIDALTSAGTIPADVAAELHAAVGEIQADNATLAGDAA